jgi:hypothetical protein
MLADLAGRFSGGKGQGGGVAGVGQGKIGGGGGTSQARSRIGFPVYAVDRLRARSYVLGRCPSLGPGPFSGAVQNWHKYE